jgi:predicted amidophosphoribosyltransferase
VVAADLVADVIREPPEAAGLAFVPPDDERRLQRGFHPAERLARELGKRWGLPVTPLLVRKGASRRQRGLTLRERRRNVKQAFRAVGTPPPRIVLVDDVYTSGATAAAAASALRKEGARRVDVVTFARAVR